MTASPKAIERLNALLAATAALQSLEHVWLRLPLDARVTFQPFPARPTLRTCSLSFREWDSEPDLDQLTQLSRFSHPAGIRVEGRFKSDSRR